MLSRKIDWSILAQCDYFVVKRFVESDDREAMRTVTPLRDTIFDRKVAREPLWAEAYESVRKAYCNLEPDFKIAFDSFGGYRLIYKGKKTLQPPTILRRTPIGFVRAVPEGVVTNLSVMSSERTGEQLLLLGPMRFVNSDCNPNSEYDFSSSAGVVELKVKRRILHGDEVLVKYGPDFFEFNECQSRTCQLQNIESDCTAVLDLLVDILIQEMASEVIGEMTESNHLSRPEHLETNETFDPPSFSLPDQPIAKKRRIRGRELVEEINYYEQFPIDGTDSSPSVDMLNRSSQINSTEILSWASDYESSSVFSEDESYHSDPAQGCDDESGSDTSPCGSLDDTIPNINLRFSSPIPFNNPESFDAPVSSITQSDVTVADLPDNEEKTKLFPGSKVKVSEATDLTALFCSRYHLSDECSSTLHSMIKSFLPDGNHFPSGYSHLQKTKRNFAENIRFFRNALTTQFACLIFVSSCGILFVAI